MREPQKAILTIVSFFITTLAFAQTATNPVSSAEKPDTIIQYPITERGVYLRYNQFAPFKHLRRRLVQTAIGVTIQKR